MAGRDPGTGRLYHGLLGVSWAIIVVNHPEPAGYQPRSHIHWDPATLGTLLLPRFLPSPTRSPTLDHPASR
jgi:hypothetical protein